MNILDNLYMSAVKAAKEKYIPAPGFDIVQQVFRNDPTQTKLREEHEKEAVMTPIEENPPRERYPEERDEE